MKHNRQPIGNTCPSIDEVIKKLDQIKSWSNDIIYYCDMAESEIEDLRQANSQLRYWGIDEAERVDELEEKTSELELKIEELKEELNNVELQLKQE
jgi:TolA-binding protein